MRHQYEYYNDINGDLDHVHVEVEYSHLDRAYGHMTRIAEHGVANVIADGGWYFNGEKVVNANFVYNWGSGPTVKLRNGKVV